MQVSFFIYIYILNNRFSFINMSFYIILVQILLNININMPNEHFSEKSILEAGLLFFERRRPFFELEFFASIFDTSLYQKARIDHRIIFIFGNKVKIIVNYKSILVFLSFL